MPIFIMIKKLFGFLRRENLLRLLVILLVLVLMSTVALALFEPKTSLLNAFWWSIVTITTVGYGDITPVTIPGRIIGIFIMLFGIGLLGMFTASIASFMVDRKIKENKGLRTVIFQNHIIICEWNFRAKEIIKEIRNDKRLAEKPIVLIASIEEKPVDDENLYFIKGDFSEETFSRANLQKAQSVIILGNDELDVTTRDARVVLTTLTVESLNQNVYTIVEVADGANAEHCRRAHADEIIVTHEFSSKLIAGSARDHGISSVMFELLSSDYGNNLFRMPVSQEFSGKSFIDVYSQLKKERNLTVLAVQDHENGKVISNPRPEYKVHEEDGLIIIGELTNDG